MSLAIERLLSSYLYRRERLIPNHGIMEVADVQSNLISSSFVLATIVTYSNRKRRKETILQARSRSELKPLKETFPVPVELNIRH